MKTMTAIALIVLLAACGGGDPEDSLEKTTTPVNCKLDPKVCV